MPQPDEHEPNLPSVHELSAIAQDLESTGVSLKRHPIACLRERLQREANVRACTLLRDTELSMKAIAGRLGFRAASSFSTAFLRTNGGSPRDFRARHR